VWDQTVSKVGLDEPQDDGGTEAKVQPLFTKGTGKKKEQGRNLWSDEGMRYCKRAEKVWKKVYKDETIMVELYRGFEMWLDIYGRDIFVSKNSTQSLFSMVASWTTKDDEENNISGEKEEVDPIDGSDEDEEEG
jgi:hypothetical protein